MSYYWFNRKKILQKAKERDRCKNLSEEEKGKIKEYQRIRYQLPIQYKNEALQNKWVLFLRSKRMSENTLKFDNIWIKKKRI